MTLFFEKAYSTQDSATYEQMLDELYEFENLPDSSDAGGIGEIWFRDTELRIHGRMFSGWSNSEGLKVRDIQIDITFLGALTSTDFFQDQPDNEEWKKCVTEVDLVVVVEDPASTDGTGIINKVVFSKQDFWVRPDPEDPGYPDDPKTWVIRRQVDQQPLT